MSSINVDLNYFDHIKTKRLVARLGPGADVLPIKLWTHVGKYKPGEGSIAMLEAELEHVLGWWGEKGALAKALIEIGFVTREGDTWFVHDWLEHSGHLAWFKERAEKAARKRWGIKRKRSNATSNAKQPSKQSSCSTSSTLLSITNNQAGEWFEEFWKEYPRKIGKPEAIKYFKADIKTASDFEAVMLALRNYKAEIVKLGTEEKYIKHGSSFMSKGRWKDYLNGTHDSASGVDLKAELRAKREAERARTVVAPREVSDGVRNSQIVPPSEGRGSTGGTNQ